MFKVLILVCSINLSPSDCQLDNAIDVINGPAAQNEMMCGFYGQAYVADTSLTGQRNDEYVKVKCTRSSIGKTVG
jgi:hypothetical protein